MLPADTGLDVIQPFDVLAAIEREPLLAMLRDPARPVGWIIGNTRALWPALRAARQADPALRASRDPVQVYCERVVEAAAPAGARVWYSHRRYDGAFVPFQRAAVLAGLGELTPGQLVVNPVYGPWFALRAIVTMAGEPPPLPPPVHVPGAVDAATEAALAHALKVGTLAAWLAVREACPIGRDWRYSDAQIRYHYGHDMRALDAA
jgi:methylmalonic aciduria homocystinuria type C protein